MTGRFQPPNDALRSQAALIMPIKITLSEGADQYEKARSYFLQLSKDAKKDARRAFQAPPRDENILGRVRTRIRNTIKKVQKCDGTPRGIERAMGMLPHHLDSKPQLSFLLAGVDPIFEGCILHGQLAYVNAAGFHFARLDDQVYGIAVEGRGSYLVEVSE